MLIVDNKLIETPIKELLNLLQQQLYLNGINKLNTVNFKCSNAQITCPIHKNGQESKPSCDVLLQDKTNFDGSVTQAGTVHCFSCGYKASFPKFVADCLDITYRQAIEWLLNVSTYSFIEDSRDFNCDIVDEDKKTNLYENLPAITLDELKSYDYIHDYMFKRKLSLDVINKFEVGYDPVTDSITFPVYIDGKCIFVAKRRVKYKRFDLPEINPKPIYGLDYCKGDSIIVCEGVIDALTCWTYGKEAVALFGTGSEYQAKQLNNIRQRHIILALDGDYAGKKGMHNLSKYLTNKIVTKLNIPNGRDINDLSKEEFLALDEIF